MVSTIMGVLLAGSVWAQEAPTWDKPSSRLSELPSNLNDSVANFVMPSGTVDGLIQKQKGHPKAMTFYLLALSYANDGEESLALSTIGSGLALDPFNVKLLSLRGALLVRTNRVTEAKREFNRILELDPENVYARESLRTLEGPKIPVPIFSAPIKTPKGKEGGATASGSGALGKSGPAPRLLDPGFFDSMSMKKRCYFQLAATKRAQQRMEAEKPEAKGKFDAKALVSGQFLAAEPVCPDGGTISWKGENPVCSKHGEFAAVEAEVQTVYADFNEGLKAKFGRNYPEAKTAFKKVINLFPTWGEAFYQLADTHFRLGEDKEAIEQIRACLKLEHGNLDARLLLANLYFKTGKKDASMNILQEIVKSVPESIHALSAKTILSAIKSGKNYYQMFPPD